MDNIWYKPNVMPESVSDRSTKAHEYVFQMAKRPNYYYNADAVKEPVTGTANRKASMASIAAGTQGQKISPKAAAQEYGVKNSPSWEASTADLVDRRNRRSVWMVPTKQYSGATSPPFRRP